MLSALDLPMLSLDTTDFPSSASDLESQLNRSLERIFSVKADPVILRDASYPHLAEIRVSLDGARLRADPPHLPVVSGKTSSALEINHLTLSASPLFLGPAKVNLSVSVREAQLGQGKDSNARIVLFLESATGGAIEISTAPADLEALIMELARNHASKQGISIDGLQLKLQQESAHSLAAEVRLRVRKLFLSASLRVTGQLALDDQLNLKISGLHCTGDGRMATLACGLLTPFLQKIDGRAFPLVSLPLGGIRLRDVRITVGEDQLCVTAEFGSAA
jgi:hypothetical protein